MTFDVLEKVLLMFSLMVVIALLVFVAIRKCEEIAERDAQEEVSEEELD